MDLRSNSVDVVVPLKLESVLVELLEALRYADDTNSNAWDFAVSMGRLVNLGATESDLRWLVLKGLVDHGKEVTIEGDDGREFRPTGNLTFSSRTCFVLNDRGIITAMQCRRESLPVLSESETETVAVPHWNGVLRQLQLDGKIVKSFKWPAINQETVLCAFQEEGWPRRIDDPLPPHPEQNPKRRLADTIKCLNRKQYVTLIHFRGDGTGEGVIWEHASDKPEI